MAMIQDYCKLRTPPSGHKPGDREPCYKSPLCAEHSGSCSRAALRGGVASGSVGCCGPAFIGREEPSSAGLRVPWCPAASCAGAVSRCRSILNAEGAAGWVEQCWEGLPSGSVARQGKAAGTMSRQANRGTESKKMVTGACDLGGWGGMEVFWGRGPARGASLNWKGAFYQPWEGVVPLEGRKGLIDGSRAEISSGSVPGAGQVGGPLEELENLFPRHLSAIGYETNNDGDDNSSSHCCSLAALGAGPSTLRLLSHLTRKITRQVDDKIAVLKLRGCITCPYLQLRRVRI